MNNRRKQSEKYWKDLITRWHQSGLSRREYCRRENISYWTFRDWLKKFELEKSSQLVRVPAEAYPKASSPESTIEITINHNISIRIKKGFDGELLRKLLCELGVRI